MPSKELTLVRKAMNQDLEESALTGPATIRRLKCKPLTVNMMYELTGYDVPGYKIPYFDIDGKPLQDFYRVKFLIPPRNEKQKYWQPPETLPHLYFPPTAALKWREIANDTSVPLFITEGEKKAACATAHDIPCIGLGGVWSFKSKKTLKPILDDFKEIKWEGRTVIIVFDNDIVSKPEVMMAMRELSSRLRDMGVAKVLMKLLPQEEDGTKLGVDDFIVQYGVEAFHELEPIFVSELMERMLELNERYAMIPSVADDIFCTETRRFSSGHKFVSQLEADNNVIEAIPTQNGKTKETKIKVAKEWLEWPGRRKLKGITFAPGEPTITTNGEYNLWEGYPYTPKPGPIKPFLDLVKQVIPDEHDREWFLQWAAYPLQHPGTKLFTAVMVWGGQGTGKTFLGKILKNLYGKHGRSVTPKQFKSQFNDWVSNTQFALGDEIIFHGSRQEADDLKDNITREDVTVNAKFQPPYTVPDLCNYFFTSNHPDAIYMEPDDRRFFVVKAGDKRRRDFYQTIDKWISRDEEKAYGAIMNLLINQIDTSNFDPKGEAPFTNAKDTMVYTGMSGIDQWLHDALENPQEFLTIGNISIKRDLFTAGEIRALMPDHMSQASTEVAIGKALQRMGLHQRVIKVTKPDGTKTTRRVYPMRNVSHWQNRSKGLGENYMADYEAVMGYGDGKVASLEERRRKKKFKKEETETEEK